MEHRQRSGLSALREEPELHGENGVQGEVMDQLFEFTRRLKGLPSSRPVISAMNWLHDDHDGDWPVEFGDGDWHGNGHGACIHQGPETLAQLCTVTTFIY